MSSKIVQFTRRPINEWPRRVYLADFGDGDACRPYTYIQYPDDTTPEYIRSDIANARIAELEAAIKHVHYWLDLSPEEIKALTLKMGPREMAKQSEMVEVLAAALKEPAND